MISYSSSKLKEISDIIHTINTANRIDDLSSAIAGIAVSLRAQYGSIVTVNSDGRGTGKAALYGVKTDFYEKYRNEHFEKDRIFPTAFKRGLHIWRPTDIVTQKEWETSPVFTELLHPQGIFHTMVTAFGTALRPIGLMFIARDKDGEPFSDEDMRFVEIIYPHIRAALREIMIREMPDKVAASLIYAVDSIARPIYIFNEENAPVYINNAARDMCSTLNINEDSMLSIVRTSLKQWNSFSEPGLCRDAFCKFGDQTYGLFPIVLEKSEATYRVVMLIDVAAYVKLSLRVLIDENGLTDRESEVCMMLTHGFTNKEMSDRLFISSETVKDHVKSVLTKLRLDTRAEVAPLVLRLMK